MPDQIQINRVTNANVYMNGTSLLGRAEEVELPQVKHKMADHKAIGMVGTFETFAGVDKMRAKFKWSSIYEEVYALIGHPTKPQQLQVRSSISQYQNGGVAAEVPFVALMNGTWVDPQLGNFKQHENVETMTEFSCTYIKVQINGQDVLEIDVLNNIYKVAGEDILAQYRANIGA